MLSNGRNERILRDQKEGDNSNTWAKGQRTSLDDSASLIRTHTSSLVPKVKLKPKLSTWEGGEGWLAGLMMESLIGKTLFTKMRAGLQQSTKHGKSLWGPFPPLDLKKATRTTLLWGLSATYAKGSSCLGTQRSVNSETYNRFSGIDKWKWWKIRQERSYKQVVERWGRDFLSKGVDGKSFSGIVMCNPRLKSEEASQRRAKHSCCQEPEGDQLGHAWGSEGIPQVAGKWWVRSRRRQSLLDSQMCWVMF